MGTPEKPHGYIQLVSPQDAPPYLRVDFSVRTAEELSELMEIIRKFEPFLRPLPSPTHKDGEP